MSTPFRHPIEIRFADIDAAGHVNNAVYFNYFEQARINWFKQHIGDWDWSERGLILVRNEIDYIHPVYLHDNIEVQVRNSRIGTKSFEQLYAVFRKEEGDKHVLCTRGKSVLVCFNYSLGKSIEIPATWRPALEPVQ